jgi:hypothetical protein
MSSADLRICSAPNMVSTLASHKKNPLKVMAIPGPCLVGRSAGSGLASNPEHLTDSDASASSRKVAWSCRPRAAVYSSLVLCPASP